MDKSKTQRALVINACSSNPPASIQAIANSKILDGLAPEELPPMHPMHSESLADQSDFKIEVPVSKSVRLVEEIDVIGLSSQARENLRSIPIIGEVEFKCKLVNYHPLSEKRYFRLTERAHHAARRLHLPAAGPRALPRGQGIGRQPREVGGA